MVNILFLIVLTGFITSLLAAILFSVFKKQIVHQKRIMLYFGEGGASAVKNTPVDKEQPSRIKLLAKIYWNKGTQGLNKRISKVEQKRVDTMLKEAGYPFKSALDFRMFQLMLSAGLALPVFIFLLPISDNKLLTWLMIGTMALLGLRLPLFYLGKKKTARTKAINKAVPDFFDTVNLLLEAGMGLDLALAEVSQKNKGPLADEFLQTLEDMKLGKSRREAFYELRKRVPSNSFQGVITSMIQADQLGIGMVKVLGSLTVRIREQRREAAREQAMKAPVKMLFPMIFFIFPSIFIVILGPLVIHFMTKGLGG